MSQANFTPISLYYSTTASAVPTAANLVPGELAINTNDGKLYYEDSSGVVQVLATKSTGSIGGSNTQVQFNNSGSLGGSSGLTWDGSFLTTSSIKNSALTNGRVTYAGASGLLVDSANLTFSGSLLAVTGTQTITNSSGSTLTLDRTSNPGSLQLNFNGTQTGQVQALSGGGLIFYQGSSPTEGFRLTPTTLYTASGVNVGIGTSSPDTTTLLTVAGAVTITGANSGHGASRLKLGQDSSAISQIRFYGADASTAGILQFTGSSSDGNVGGERMRIDSSGNLLVGTTTANSGVSIFPSFSSANSSGIDIKHTSTSASGEYYVTFQYNNSVIGYISQNGTTAVAYNTTSDYRLKENIEPMTGALATVAQLNPVTYKWKTDGSDGQGFIAHELQAVVPDCVTGEKDGVDKDGKPVYQGIDTSFLVATLVSAIQELKAEFDAYKATHP